MTDLLKSSLGPSVQIDTHFPMQLAKALADPNQLELAILNLALNARDAMPKGGTISVAAKAMTVFGVPALKPGRYICISVFDRGIGTDEETLQRALESHFYNHGSPERHGAMPLLVHGMAEQSGGKLTLESRLGQGTTAKICIPASTLKPKAIALSPSLERAGYRTGRKHGIVSVDDDPLASFNTCNGPGTGPG